MEGKEISLRMAGLCCLITLLSPNAFAQAEVTLDRAYQLLVQNKYQLAKNAANEYLATNPRRYRAEFIVSVADCVLHRGQSSAMQGMAALKRDYALNEEAEKEIEAWIAYCAPKQPQSDQPGVSVSALMRLPEIASAAPAKPNRKPLPPMSDLIHGTSYSGDDYTELSGIAAAEDCARACRLQAPCRSMTYAKSSKKCWLKRSVPPAQYGDDFVSAVKQVN